MLVSYPKTGPDISPFTKICSTETYFSFTVVEYGKDLEQLNLLDRAQNHVPEFCRVLGEETAVSPLADIELKFDGQLHRNNFSSGN